MNNKPNLEPIEAGAHLEANQVAHIVAALHEKVLQFDRAELQAQPQNTGNFIKTTAQNCIGVLKEMAVEGKLPTTDRVQYALENIFKSANRLQPGKEHRIDWQGDPTEGLEQASEFINRSTYDESTRMNLGMVAEQSLNALQTTAEEAGGLELSPYATEKITAVLNQLESFDQG